MTAVLAVLIVSSGVAWLASSFASSESRWSQSNVATLGVQLLCLSTLNAWLWLPQSVGGQAAPLLALHIAAVACLAKANGRSSRPSLPPWIAAFVVASFLSAFNSSDVLTAFFFALRNALIFVAAGLAANTLSPERLRHVLVQFAALVAVWLGLAMALVPADTFTPMRAPLYRYSLQVSVLGLNRIHIPTLGIVLMAAAVVSKRTRLRLLLGGAGGAMLILPQSRTLFISAAVFFVVAVLTTKRQAVLPVAAVGALVLATLLTVPQARQLWDRESAVPQVENAASYRSELFAASMERAREKPILGDGLGVGNVGIQIDLGRDGMEWGTHTELSTALTTTGIVGAVITAWGYLHGIRLGWRRRATDWMPLGVMLAMLAATPLQTILSRPNVLLLPYLLVVIPAYAESRRSAPESRSAVTKPTATQ